MSKAHPPELKKYVFISRPFFRQQKNNFRSRLRLCLLFTSRTWFWFFFSLDIFDPFQIHGQTYDVETEWRPNCVRNFTWFWSIYECCYRWNRWRMPWRHQKHHWHGGMYHDTQKPTNLSLKNKKWMSHFAGDSWKFNRYGRGPGEGSMKSQIKHLI